jgi:hypothetical protein
VPIDSIESNIEATFFENRNKARGNLDYVKSSFDTNPLLTGTYASLGKSNFSPLSVMASFRPDVTSEDKSQMLQLIKNYSP